jgi:hypothetical protein
MIFVELTDASGAFVEVWEPESGSFDSVSRKVSEIQHNVRVGEIIVDDPAGWTICVHRHAEYPTCQCDEFSQDNDTCQLIRIFDLN